MLPAASTATVGNPLGAADLKINVNDPLDTITFSDGSSTTPAACWPSWGWRPR